MPGVEDWSTTAASNATADSNINWVEGQLPSTVNDSARAEMAAIAAWLRTIGAYGTVGGTGDAITLTTTQTPSALGPAVVGFIAGATNTGAVTLHRDGLGVKPLRAVSGSDLAAGDITVGRAYLACYTTASSGQWILFGVGPTKSYVDTQDTAAIASSASAAAALYALLSTTISGTSGNITGGGSLAANRTLDLATTAVTPGSYTRSSFTVDAYGRLTAASSGSSALSSLTGGSVCLQRKYLETTSATSLSTLPIDGTIPQNTEGTEIFSQAITPVSASSYLIIRVHGAITRSAAARVGMALFVDSTANALAATYGGISDSAYPIDENLSAEWKIASGSTSARTYKLRAGGSSTSTWNSVTFGGIAQGSFVIEEWLDV